MDYRIQPVTVDGYAGADGVYKNEYGAWLGVVDWQESEDGSPCRVVFPLTDEDLDFVPAPNNWRDLILEVL